MHKGEALIILQIFRSGILYSLINTYAYHLYLTEQIREDFKKTSLKFASLVPRVQGGGQVFKSGAHGV